MLFRLVARRNQALALEVVGFRQRLGALLVKGTHGFDRLSVSPFGPMHGRAEVKAVDVKPEMAVLLRSVHRSRCSTELVSGSTVTTLGFPQTGQVP